MRRALAMSANQCLLLCHCVVKDHRYGATFQEAQEASPHTWYMHLKCHFSSRVVKTLW